jgi:transcriptional regulator with XRE-family HTH domain
MPATTGDGTNKPPRTLAEKLSRLRAERAPEGGKVPSWEALAKEITEKTGVAISGAYLWELGTDKPGTNVGLNHLKALAKFFGRRISYFADDEVAFEDDTQAQLALLEQLRRLDVRHIRLENMDGDVSPETVTDLLSRLQTLDVLREADVREVALQVTRLTAEQRVTLGNVARDPSLLDALPRATGLVEAAAGLTDEQIASAIRALGQTDVLEALQDEDVSRIARQCLQLLPSSKEAVLSMIEQLTRLETGKA